MIAAPAHSKLRRPARLTTAVVLSVLALAAPPAAAAGCQTELRLLGEDLQGVTLTDRQTQDLAGLLMLARRHCWIQRERKAMELINQARALTGLAPTTGEFDWENVPLENLEPAAAPATPLPGVNTDPVR